MKKTLPHFTITQLFSINLHVKINISYIYIKLKRKSLKNSTFAWVLKARHIQLPNMVVKTIQLLNMINWKFAVWVIRLVLYKYGYGCRMLL